MPGWLVTLSWAFVLAGLLTAAIVWVDVRAHPQRMKIMNVVWPVTALYFPLAGWWIYKALGRPQAVDAPARRGNHAHWKSTFLSATHCGSGCVLGDVIAAPVVYLAGWTLLGERLYADYAASFTVAYAFGIAFQYFPLRAMGESSPAKALKDAIKADTLSLVAFEVGMFAWMAVVYFVLLRQQRPEPSSMTFWFMMQIAMVLGFITTYPANWLLVKWGIKRGM